MIGVNRYLGPERFAERKDFLSLNIKCVFIAHQKDDSQQARIVANYLQQAGVEVFFDEFNDELRLHHEESDARAVTRTICSGIANSSHMLVLISPNTINSYWVPFEIGYGFDRTELFVLRLKNIPDEQMPEYIHTATIIDDIEGFNRFISSLTGKTSDAMNELGEREGADNSKHTLELILERIVTTKNKS